MPCFHGLAVSIHTPEGPLPEYSIQKQSKFHRITSYIPVPPPKVPSGATKPEQSTFAISITLLTPGLSVPYSTPKPTPEDPYPRPKIVGGLPGYNNNDKNKFGAVIGPYLPLTSSPNETIAAYIYFDGRAKEEVATLLRRGEETWVNSRWVSVPESEGGGLAEREFLFREVGLERWLNGLDLEGKDKDVAARIERRKQRLERKRRKKREQEGSDDEDDKNPLTGRRESERISVLRYGENSTAPVESLSGDEGLFTTDSDSEDEPPMPDASGQIKVALFRVLASGEIKRGEYSPQFDVNDDDGTDTNGNNDADVDHTTSFAKPKTLDPKTISTQTVTGIDPPDRPYAVFTFLYRGEKQLQKMGILAAPPVEKKPVVQASNKKKTGIHFSSLGPLNNKTGTKNFAGYRDPTQASPSTRKKRSGKDADDNAMDSDADDDEDDDDKIPADADAEVKEGDSNLLSPEDARRQGELTEGVRKIKLKRQHSAEPLAADSKRDIPPKSNSPQLGTTPGTGPTDSSINGRSSSVSASPALGSVTPGITNATTTDAAGIASPYKKQRASLPGLDENVRKSLSGTLGALKAETAGSSGDGKPPPGSSLGPAWQPKPLQTAEEKMEEEEEL